MRSPVAVARGHHHNPGVEHHRIVRLQEAQASEGGTRTISVIVPTYNEKENLQELATRIFKACGAAGIDAELVVVDDNSPDGTGAYAEELAKTNRVKVVHRPGKLGLSSAVLDGLK